MGRALPSGVIAGPEVAVFERDHGGQLAVGRDRVAVKPGVTGLFGARASPGDEVLISVRLMRIQGMQRRYEYEVAGFNERMPDVHAVGAIHVYHQYTIRIPYDRDGFARTLAREHGVGTGIDYPAPSHRLPSFGRKMDPLRNRARRARGAVPRRAPHTVNRRFDGACLGRQCRGHCRRLILGIPSATYDHGT